MAVTGRRMDDGGVGEVSAFARTSPSPKPRSSLLLFFFSSLRYRGKERLLIPPQQHRALRSDSRLSRTTASINDRRRLLLAHDSLGTYNFQLQWRWTYR
jgi:hypothetical protein